MDPETLSLLKAAFGSLPSAAIAWGLYKKFVRLGREYDEKEAECARERREKELWRDLSLRLLGQNETQTENIKETLGLLRSVKDTERGA